MHVIFVEPAFPHNQREFVRGLKDAGAAVTGIGERPVEFLDDELKSWMVGYEQVVSVCHLSALHGWRPPSRPTSCPRPRCARPAASPGPRCGRPSCVGTSRP
jgi:hypothetical protein